MNFNAFCESLSDVILIPGYKTRTLMRKIFKHMIAKLAEGEDIKIVGLGKLVPKLVRGKIVFSHLHKEEVNVRPYIRVKLVQTRASRHSLLKANKDLVLLLDDEATFDLTESEDA